MNKLRLSVAMGDYDRTRALLDGRVQIDGIIIQIRMDIIQLNYPYIIHKIAVVWMIMGVMSYMTETEQLCRNTVKINHLV